ncbi:MAG: sigma 54-interacting transcriptional regulator [Myxococcales bacterium]|nr:sigma 54-interacting transcriptional regulator [Myxococcales bacterium]
MTIHQPQSQSNLLPAQVPLERALDLTGHRSLLLVRVDFQFDHEKSSLSEQVSKECARTNAVVLNVAVDSSIRPLLFPVLVRTLVDRALSHFLPVPSLVTATLNHGGSNHSGSRPMPRDVDRPALFEALRCVAQDLAGGGPVVVLTSTPVTNDLDFVDFIDYLRNSDPSSAAGGEDFSDACDVHRHRHPHGRRTLFRWVGLLPCDVILPPTWSTDRRFCHVANTGDGAQTVQNWLQSPTVRDKILRVTGGNPRYLQQLLQSMPSDMDDLVVRPGRALTGLAGQLRDVLVCAGKPLRVKTLAHLTGGNDLIVGRTINAMRDAGFINAAPDQTGWMWACSRSARALKDDVPADKIKKINNDIADLTIEHWFVDGDPANLQDAVWRYLEAGNVSKALEYGLEAATIAEGALSTRNALDIIEQLLQLPTDPLTYRKILRRGSRLSATLGDFGRAAGYAFQYLEQTGTLDSEQLRGELARVFVLAGHVSEAIGVLTGTIHGDTDAQFPETANNIALLADAYRIAGKLDESLVTCRKYVGPTVAEVSLAYGSIYFRRGEYGEAERHYTDAANVSGAPWDVVARARHNLGLIALSSERYTDAARHLHEGLQLCEAHGELRGAALGRYNLGIVMEHMERFPLAERLLAVAADTFLLSGQKQLVCSALVTQSDLMLRLGNLKQAHQLAQRALELATKHHIDYSAATAKVRLGLANLERGRLGLASQWLTEATEWFRETHNRSDLSWALSYLIETATENGELERAQQHVDELWDTTADAGNELAATTRLCEATLRLAKHDHAEASRLAQEAFVLFERVGQREGQIRSLNIQSQALISLGDVFTATEIQQQARAMLLQLAEVLPEATRPRFLSRRVFATLTTTTQTDFSVAGRQKPQSDQSIKTPDTSHKAHKEKPPGLQSAHPGIPKLLGNSPLLRQALDFAAKVARSEMPVLLLGETGTGKELVARGIVNISQRASKPFVRVNVASFVENLLESELFGHERGAFTGAVTRRSGAFEQADCGTLFLDEIGDISPKMQVSLLRVLQEGEVVRVGGSQPIKVNVRVLCATNRDLERLIREGRFRLDLYHRICGFAVKLPPLRERHDDVVLLATEFLLARNEESNRQVSLSSGAIQVLKKHPWPGNVRELDQVIRSAHLLAEDSVISPAVITRSMSSFRIVPTQPDDAIVGSESIGSMDAATRKLEVEMIRQALEQSGGNITRAAELLCIKRPRLSLKIKEYGIFVPTTKDP